MDEKNELIKKITASLNYKFKNSINDIDFNIVAQSFVENGGYNKELSYKDNMEMVLSYIAIGKAENKF